jgi:hypothetical protein
VTDKSERRPFLTPAGRQAAAERQSRLAAALRENLRKRKAQQRARAAEPPAPSDTAEVSGSRDGKE